MFVVDTNILIYAADRSSPWHARCHDLIEEWRETPSAWYVTWSVVYEFLRVVTHPGVFRTPWQVSHAWRFVEALLSAPGLSVLAQTERHREVAAATLDELPFLGGNILHDAHTAVLMREHGIRRIYTRDTDFHRFSFLEVVDPCVETQ